VGRVAPKLLIEPAVDGGFIAITVDDDDEIVIGQGATEIGAVQDLVRQGMRIKYRPLTARAHAAWRPLPATGRIPGAHRFVSQPPRRRVSHRTRPRRRRATTGTSKSSSDPPGDDDRLAEPLPGHAGHLSLEGA
jgi:hypothetical protein